MSEGGDKDMQDETFFRRKDKNRETGLTFVKGRTQRKQLLKRFGEHLEKACAIKVGERKPDASSNSDDQNKSSEKVTQIFTRSVLGGFWNVKIACPLIKK